MLENVQLYINVNDDDVFVFKILSGDKIIQEVNISSTSETLDFSVLQDNVGKPITLAYFTDEGCKSMFVTETTLTSYVKIGDTERLEFEHLLYAPELKEDSLIFHYLDLGDEDE